MLNLSVEKNIRGRILVVEDVPLVRNLLTEILTQQGHRITAAADGLEALHHLEREDYDLVISDLHMPGLNGLDLTGRIKQLHPSLPVVIVTGYPTLDKAVAAIKQGACEFVPKPFNVRHITSLVQTILRDRNRLSEPSCQLAEINNQAVIEKLNQQLQMKVDQLTKLYTISESFQSFMDNTAMFQHIVDLAAELTGSRKVSLMSLDPSRDRLVIRAAIGLPPEIQRNTCIQIGEGVAGRVARHARLLRVTSKDIHASRSNGARAYISQSWLSVPLFIGDELFGVLNLTDKVDSSDFTEEDEFLVLMLVEKAGIRIENNALYEGIYTNLLDTLKTLVSTIEAKDPYTRYHSQRVTETALALARYVQCSDEDCESIAFAGILHDIGKIGIGENILLKPGMLDHSEYEIIKRHPVISDTILQPLGLIDAERQIIRHHHERMDGAGYPDGLRGSQISLLSRIVSIADAFDAMTATRAYRKAMPLPEVIKELHLNAGKQFDADLVDAIVEAIHAGHINVGEATPLSAGKVLENGAARIATSKLFFDQTLKNPEPSADKVDEDRQCG